MKKLLMAALAAAFGHFAANGAEAVVEITLKDGRKLEAQRRPLEIKGGKATFTWARSAIPADAKSVIVRTDFAKARKGEEGYWVQPDGTLGRYTQENGGKTIRRNWFPMPIFGMKTERAAFVAIVTGMPYNFSVVTRSVKGEYETYADFDVDIAEAYEDISIDYCFLEGEDADYSGMGRRYRKHQLDRGACRPIAERAKGNALLDYAIKAPEVRMRLAWKRVPSPVPDQVTRNEPTVKPVITFDRLKEITDECRKQGVPSAQFCLVGWNVGGHDGRFPQIFPVEPSLGGEEKLKEAIRHMQGAGYQVVGHSTFRDAYMIADTWDAEYIVEKNPDGTLMKGKTTWGGGRLYTMCPQRAYEKFCHKQCAEMATLGFKGLFYVDVTTSRPLFPCRDRRHPLNNGERAKWEAAIMEELRGTFGGAASEGAFDFCIGSVDSALTVAWSRPFETPKNKMVERTIPLWQIVYHGVVLSTPFRTSINCTANPDRRYLLKCAEFGGRPTFYWHSMFVTGRAPSMGTIDLTATTDEEMRQSVAWMKEGCDEYARRSDLQYHFMDRHEEVAEGVFRVTYSNGAKVLANYNGTEATADGVKVPPVDYVVIR